jgi:RNA polymerase sigma-70 factor (ECF subfamily)
MSESDLTASWISAAKAGDELALTKLLAAYHPRLRARAEARMDAPLKARLGPDDLLQEVYLQVFRQIGRFEDRGPAAFLNWLYTILDHKLIDARRAGHRQARDVDREQQAPAVASADSYLSLLGTLQAEGGTPSRVVRRDEAVGALLTCLARVSAAHREVIQLRYLEVRPLAEVATRLGKSEDAVVALSQRALKALRAALDELGEFSTGP